MSVLHDGHVRNGNSHTLSPDYPPPPLRDIEAEQNLLGLLLSRPNKLAELHWFRTDYFDDALHQAIYEQLLRMASAGGPIDAARLKSWADTVPPIEAQNRTLTCFQYLQRMMAFAPVGLSMRGFAEAVRDCWQRRQLAGIGQDIADGLQRGVEIPTIIKHVQDMAFDLSEQGNVRNTRVSVAEAMTRAIDAMNDAYQNGGRIRGVSTGLADLDAKIGGLGNSDLIVLAGRPAMGKTALAMTMSKAAARSGKHVLFFSQEMSAEQIAMRMISEHSALNGERLRRGQFSDNEFRMAYEAAQELGKLPIVFEEAGAISASQVALHARRAALQKRLDLIVIDYLQLMGSDGRVENRTQELTKTTMALKALAKSLDVPILLLSQLSRDVEKRADKKPQLSDLRESGSIEQDADLVLFVFRDDYYLSQQEPSESDLEAYTAWQKRMHESAGVAEVIAAKNRHGSTGIIKLAFDGERTSFADLARENRYAQTR